MVAFRDFERFGFPFGKGRFKAKAVPGCGQSFRVKRRPLTGQYWVRGSGGI